MWCFFSWRSTKCWFVKILRMAYYPLSMAGSYKHYKPFNVEQFLHPNAHVAFSICRGTFSSYPAPVHKDMFSTRKRRDFVTQPKSTEKFTIQGKHEVFWLPFPAKTSLDSSFQFHFHFLVFSLRFPGDGGTLLWSLSVAACYCYGPHDHSVWCMCIDGAVFFLNVVNWHESNGIISH